MSGSLSIHCVWCHGPLLDVEHAKQHVRRCAAAPWTAEIALLTREIDQIKRERDEAYAALGGRTYEYECTACGDRVVLARPFAERDRRTQHCAGVGREEGTLRRVSAASESRGTMTGANLRCECGAGAADVAPDYEIVRLVQPPPLAKQWAVAWTCTNGHRQITGARSAHGGGVSTLRSPQEAP